MEFAVQISDQSMNQIPTSHYGGINHAVDQIPRDATIYFCTGGICTSFMLFHGEIPALQGDTFSSRSQGGLVVPTEAPQSAANRIADADQWDPLAEDQ